MEQDNLQEMITRIVQKQLNEAIVLNNETYAIENIVKSLQNIYKRVIEKGASKSEITVEKIANIIHDLQLIQKHWSNVIMW